MKDDHMSPEEYQDAIEDLLAYGDIAVDYDEHGRMMLKITHNETEVEPEWRRVEKVTWH